MVGVRGGIDGALVAGRADIPLPRCHVIRCGDRPGLTYLAHGPADTHVHDIVFVSLLGSATLFLILALRNLRKYLIDEGFNYWNYVLVDADHIEMSLTRLAARILSTPWRVLSGVVYGFVVAAVVYAMHVLQGHERSQLEYLGLLFFANYVTGAALYSLVAFLTITPALIRNIKIQLWETRNVAAGFVIGSTLRIGIFASIYVGLCMTSILFSEIPIRSIVLVYVGFSVLMAVTSIGLPFWFYARRIRDARDKLVTRIGLEPNTLSDQLLSASGANRAVFDRMQELMQLRQWTKTVEVVPFGLQSLTAGLLILLFNLQPLIAELVRDMWFSH